MNRKVLLSAFGFLSLLLVGIGANAQDAPPGGIKLLPGYRHETEEGFDTQVGRIWKEGGQKISYDIGCWAGSSADRKRIKEFSWYKEVVIEGQEFRIARYKKGGLKNGILVITIPDAKANFFTEARTEEDVTDALLMLTGYRGKIDCKGYGVG